MAESADAPDLGSGPERGGGSTPLARTSFVLVEKIDIAKGVAVPLWPLDLHAQ